MVPSQNFGEEIMPKFHKPLFLVKYTCDTVDGRNPAPPGISFIYENV